MQEEPPPSIQRLASGNSNLATATRLATHAPKRLMSLTKKDMHRVDALSVSTI